MNAPIPALLGRTRQHSARVKPLPMGLQQPQLSTSLSRDALLPLHRHHQASSRRSLSLAPMPTPVLGRLLQAASRLAQASGYP